MNRYYYDLHIHSCLSPCGNDDMTPNNIAGMAMLKGLNIVALTDHNSCKNCPAFFKACENFGLIPIAGMELTTAEDIHIVCLFYTLEQAMAFDREIEKHRQKIPNRPEIFGNQQILDEEDRLTGQEETLLINATDLDMAAATETVRKFGGIVYPAHIDRPANGMVETLGTIPKEYDFTCVEFYDRTVTQTYSSRFGLETMKIVCSSDAHYLENISEAENYFTFDDDPYCGKASAKILLDYLGSPGRKEPTPR